MIRARHSLVPLALATRAAGCGTKAATLARLIALGQRVPRGVVVTDREYRRHLAACGAHRSDLDEQALRQRILETPLGDGLRARLRQQVAGLYWPLAVRSSATAEDTGGASFAGQLDSTLNVRDQTSLETAIRTVWASPWSERCRAYAARQRLEPGALGVILQEQVDACCSGVLFTRDPLAGAGATQAVVEYVRGLGDRLVSGAVNPARLRIARGDGAVEHCAGGGLSDERARELLALGLELERQLGGPQDVEWSLDPQGRIVLLQARPITTAAETLTWSNANIAENFPDPVTPLLFSIVARGYSAYFRNLASGFGIARRRIEALRPALDEIVGLHAGRLYYNLSNIHAALHLVPGGARLAASFNTFTGARERPASGVPAPTRTARVLQAARIAVCAAWQYAFIGRRVARFEARADALAARLRRERLARRGAAELASDLDAFLELRLARWNDAALADAAAMVTYAVLEQLVKRAAPARTQALQNDLLKGLPGLASARPVAELWALAREVRSDPQLARLFAAHTADELAARLDTAELRTFAARFREYLELWGFRYSRELMLTSPTPEEHPAPMLAILQSYLKDDGPGPEAVSARQTQARLDATAALTARLARPAAWLLRAMLAATQGAIRLRERARMKQALVYTRLRHLLLRIGELLAARSLLAERDDVFFLTVDEVQRALARTGSTDVAATRAAVAARRAELLACAPQRPPDSLVLPRGARWRPAAVAAAPETAHGAHEALRGTSACGGATEGQARVIEDVAAIGSFQAGEILVTRQTDPGWAAVFFMVKGLVVERGGMLSHGAIIAREYGIPAVVGVDDATSHIRSGQRIRVDGDRGLVELAAT